MSEYFYRYRACWFDGGIKHYIKNGKFYDSIGACKRGIRNAAYKQAIGEKITYTIEEYRMQWVGDPQSATITRDGYYKLDVKYEEVD